MEIDEIDTATVPLKNLRSSVSIIPQDSVLFSGTLRYNLDPFGNFSDNDVWDTLEQVIKRYVHFYQSVLLCLAIVKILLTITIDLYSKIS